MPNSPTDPRITTPQQVHQQTADQIQANLQQALGETHQVIPTTSESEPEGDDLGQFYDRALWGRPGAEPSKSFLKKLLGRIKKKHPDSDVRLK